MKHLSYLALAAGIALSSCHKKPTPEPAPKLEGDWKGIDERQDMFDENNQILSTYLMPYRTGLHAINFDEVDHLYTVYNNGTVVGRFSYWITDNQLQLQGGGTFTIEEHTKSKLVLRVRQDINTTRYLIRTRTYNR
ncbi:hypothetical protein [Solirubrum puertoriconensis]|uniref:Lipocalin-like domain-containing protein n=1 Tax=Solirubrum puertoriconensis TaxID=1751427 RepID=A0A9X0HHB6_SOLP1|nr:hypothetical protein [Solirubrum puertoriconensis]KUG05852.1 hypothetical protein ASU33_00230 [Solirubrum puertoriconensis]